MTGLSLACPQHHPLCLGENGEHKATKCHINLQKSQVGIFACEFIVLFNLTTLFKCYIPNLQMSHFKICNVTCNNWKCHICKCNMSIVMWENSKFNATLGVIHNDILHTNVTLQICNVTFNVTLMKYVKVPMRLFKYTTLHLMLHYCERIAFAIVPVEVRYPDRIVGIALLL